MKTMWTQMSLFALAAVFLFSDTLIAADGVTQKIVRLTASDGVKIDAVLMHPNSGMNIGAPVIVMHHGGPSGHAARSIGAYRFAAERLARAGYTTISPVSRHSSGYYKYVLEDSIKDIDATVEFVTAFGFDRIVLAGHSMGSIRITRYQVTHKNPLVKAMVHFAPTADVYDFVGKRPAVAPIIESAQLARAAGRGSLDLHPNSVDPDTSLTPPSIGATARGRLQTPEALLSWWGPGHPTANSDFFPQLAVPQLLLAGTEDPPVPPGRMERLKELAVNSPRVDYVWYEGGDHYFTFHQDESSADMIVWLADLGLGPGRHVETELVDTLLNASFTPDGQRVPYPGVSYRADGVDRDESPLLIYTYGLGEQILEDPVHRLATLMAHRGYEGIAPQLRESGFRGQLTSTIARSAEDLADVVKSHRNGERPIVFVGYREGILWGMEAAKSYDLANVAGFVALAPSPDLRDYAEAALTEDRYEQVVERANTILADGDSVSFLVEKYFRPAPALAGSTDAFMFYPESFLDYFGPDSQANFTEYARDADAPVLMIAGSNDTMLGEGNLRDLNRLARSSERSLAIVDGADDLFANHESEAADIIAQWVSDLTD